MDLKAAKEELVVANRILAREGVVDALGHVSVRHPECPDRFLLSCSRAPELVTFDDIMEFDLDCNPILADGRPVYAERPIHGAIYRARSDVHSVVHSHAHEVIPFSITNVALRAVFHVGAPIGAVVPVWDIAHRFGDTDLLVRTMEQGEDLASTLGKASCALMRGHGCVVVSKTLQYSVLRAIFLMLNAKIQTAALQLGEVRYLSEAEIELANDMMGGDLAMRRIWQYYERRATASD